MSIKNLKILFYIIAMSVFFCAVSNGNAQPQGSCPAQALDSSGYVLLHPYFEGKNWKKSIDDNVDVYLPETLCTQNLVPVRFDIGKMIDSTVAAFSTANGGLFIMGTQYFHYAGACRDEIDFLGPKKVPLTGMTFTGTTPWYLLKDTAFNLDTVKIVLGVSSVYCLVATINTNANAIVKIDTLHMQNSNTIFAIQGGYDNILSRDTCIWVTGNNGMLRRFSYKRTSWGTEVRNDIASTETVLCVNNSYAGTVSGKIYKKNSAQTYVLDYSSSTNAVNALYPQGAIGNNGAFNENVNGAWRSSILGNGDFRYANFIKRPGGFGIELLDNQWKYSTFTYRDTASKILLTNPVDIMVNNVNKPLNPYIYNPAKILSPKDTTIFVYISDPDSNYSDLSITLNSSSMENDGTHSIGPIPDSESCHVGALRLTDGILKVTLTKDSVILKTQTELGVINVGCGICNWKNYNFVFSRYWYPNSSLFITTGKDYLKIGNQGSAVTAFGSNDKSNSIMKTPFKIIGRRLILGVAKSDLKKIEFMAFYDFAGRKLASFQNVHQTVFELPHDLTSSIACFAIKYADGSTERRMLSLIR